MIYLIVSALGFAAVENMLNIFLIPDVTTKLALSQSIARFLSATLLHALASGMFGYFLALSMLNLKKKKLFLWSGFAMATIFHGFYNYLVWLIEFDKFFVLTLALLLVVMAAIVSWQFRRLKKEIAICKIR
jgi:RsiW-degrading membrane proteinase PrsW (M82 family)